jgi:pyruvate/2-oxoglutarate/acetoin dehydrogenase E1 component
VIARISLAGFHALKKAPLKIAAPECPVPYAKNLETAMLPDADNVARQIERHLA